MKKYLYFLAAMAPACLFSQLTLTLSPSEDAAIGYHDGAGTAGNNYGNAPQLAAYAIPASAQVGGINLNRGLLKFDLSSLPPGAMVLSAYLDLYAYGPIGSYNGHTGTNNSVLERVTSNWSEMTVTWLSQPTTIPTNHVLLPASMNPTQNYLNLDVTSLVQDIRSSGINYGFMLKLSAESPTNILAFCSRDHSNTSLHPRLRLNYTLSEALPEPNQPALHMKCFPNPATDHLLIHTEHAAFPVDIRIYDFVGRLVKTQTIHTSNLPAHSTDIRLPLTDLGKGYYFIKLISGSGTSTGTFMIE